MHRTEGANNVAGLYTAGPPPTTITADALNSIQEEIAGVIEYNGIAIQTAATDTRNQLLAALIKMVPTYDAVVTSQASWDTLIERTGANAYQFKDDYKSIFCKVNDYTLTLSGGDTWGALSTNACKHLEFEMGAAIQFGNTAGYLNVNTTGSYIKNVSVKGLGTVASPTTYCFYTNTYLVLFDNCWAFSRLSNVGITGFYDNSGNILNKYINCYAGALTSSGAVTGFYNCSNVSNCNANNLDTTGGIMYGFNLCDNVSNCTASVLDSVDGNAYGFLSCSQVSGCRAYDIDTSGATGQAYGFFSCNNIASCGATDISGGDTVAGFAECTRISGCTASVIDDTSASNSYGFLSCNQISSCYAYDIDNANDDAYGFWGCNQISSCKSYGITSGAGAGDISAGFFRCEYISGCYAEHITGNAHYGYYSCTYGAALGVNASLVGSNTSCNYMDTSSGGTAVDWSILDIFV